MTTNVPGVVDTDLPRTTSGPDRMMFMPPRRIVRHYDLLDGGGVHVPLSREPPVGRTRVLT